MKVKLHKSEIIKMKKPYISPKVSPGSKFNSLCFCIVQLL